MPGRDDDGFDEQDQAEVFDEDNTNPFDRPSDAEDGEQVEDLVDVFDATSAVGDDDDDEAVIGEDLDDDEIVALARDDDDDDLEDDDLARRDAVAFHFEDDQDDVTDAEDQPGEGLDGQGRRDTPLVYVGDADRMAHARSAAQPMESKRLSDQDLRELNYQDDEDAMPAKSQNGSPKPSSRRKPARSRPVARPAGRERSFDPVDKDLHARQSDLLDEGVEETFPASDPVSVKRIT